MTWEEWEILLLNLRRRRLRRRGIVVNGIGGIGGGAPVTPGTLTAQTGTFVVSGNSAGLVHSYSALSAAVGTFALTGQSAALAYGRTLQASAGPYTLTGIAAGLVKATPGAYTLVAGTGIFTLTGDAMTPLVAYSLPAVVGTFAVTGQAVTLTKSSSGPTYTAGPSFTRQASFSASAQTFTMNSGSTYGTGLVIVGLVQEQAMTPGSAQEPTVTIGGTAMVKVAGTDDGSLRSSLWQASVTAGNGDTLSITPGASGTFDYMGVCSAFISGLASSTKTGSSKLSYGADNGGVALAAPFAVNSGGLGVILFGTTNVTGSTGTPAFTNTTSGSGDTVSTISTHVQIAMAHTATATATWDPRVTSSANINFAYSLSAAAWA